MFDHNHEDLCDGKSITSPLCCESQLETDYKTRGPESPQHSYVSATRVTHLTEERQEERKVRRIRACRQQGRNTLSTNSKTDF